MCVRSAKTAFIKIKLKKKITAELHFTYMVKYINMYTVFNSFGCLSNHDLISMTLMNGRALLL